MENTNQNDRMNDLKSFLRDEGLCGMQVFSSMSLVDHNAVSYSKDGVEVRVNYYYEYVEVLGLTADEFKGIITTDRIFTYLREDL